MEERPTFLPGCVSARLGRKHVYFSYNITAGKDLRALAHEFFSFLPFSLSFLVFLLAPPSRSQVIQVQPTQIVESSAPQGFSGKTLFWPESKISPQAERSGADSSLEALQDAGGIQSREQGSPFISLRGSASMSRVLVLLDGTNLSFSDGFGSQTLLIPEEIVGEVHVIKGPVSTYYGEDAMAGAINYVPVRRDRPLFRAGAESFGGRKIVAVFPFGADLAHEGVVEAAAAGATDGTATVGDAEGATAEVAKSSQISFWHRDVDGNFDYRIPRLGVSGTRTRNDLHLDHLSFQSQSRTGSWNHKLNLEAVKTAGSTPGSVLFPSINNFTQQAALVSWKSEGRLANFFNMTNHLYGLYSDGVFRDETSTNDLYENKSTRIVNSVSLAHSFTNQTHARFFADFFYDEGKTFSSNKWVNNAEARVELGLLGAIPANEEWVLQAGSRYSPNRGQWVSSIELLKELLDTKTWLTFSEGIHNPSYSDRFSATSFFVGNPSLKPEHSVQAELGFEKKTSSIRYGADIFAINYDNLMVSADAGSGVKTKRNIGQGQSQGFDLQGTWETEGWAVILNSTYQKAIDTSNNEALPLSPDLQLSNTLRHKFGPHSLSLRHVFWGNYFDRDFASGSLVGLGPWNTFDVVWQWKIMHAQKEQILRVGVSNLFDQARELSLGYPETQRKFFVQWDAVL